MGSFRQTSTSATGLSFEGKDSCCFYYSTIQICHAELQDFLHLHQALVACLQELKSIQPLPLKNSLTIPQWGSNTSTWVRRAFLPLFISPSSLGCLIVTSFLMTTWRNFLQSKPTFGERRISLLNSISPCYILPLELCHWLWRTSGGPLGPEGVW